MGDEQPTSSEGDGVRSNVSAIDPSPRPSFVRQGSLYSRFLSRAASLRTPTASGSHPLATPSTSGRPPLMRGQSQVEKAEKAVTDYVGLTTSDEDRAKWDAKRLRHVTRKYKVKEDQCMREVCAIDSPIGGATLVDFVPTSPVGAQHISMVSMNPTGISGSVGTTAPDLSTAGRSQSMESKITRTPRLDRKDSVIKVVYDSVTALVRKGTTKASKVRRPPLSTKSSFDWDNVDAREESTPGSAKTVNSFLDLSPYVVQRGTQIAHDTSQQHRKSMLPAMIPEETSQDSESEQTTGISEDGGRSMFRDSAASTLSDDVFLSYSSESQPHPFARPPPFSLDSVVERVDEAETDDHGGMSAAEQGPYEGISLIDLGDSRPNVALKAARLGRVSPRRDAEKVPDRPEPRMMAAMARPQLKKQVSFELPSSLISTQKKPADPLMNNIVNMLKQNNITEKQARMRGIGSFGLLCHRELGRSKIANLPKDLREKIATGEDERPFFTYWVTVVQTIVCIVSLITYGFGPFGLDRVERIDEVADTALALRRVSYYEPANLWLGPKFADLVRLGAKYSPCMRRERGLYDEIAKSRDQESRTACCVFNDRSGCYQTGESNCPRSLATWHKWTPLPKLLRSKSDSDLLNRSRPTIQSAMLTSSAFTNRGKEFGSVCGHDPSYCAHPASVRPYEWPDDIRKWPACKEVRETNLPPHMTCRITGRPCCIQLQGQCRIATEEYCKFVQGHYHHNATLCSQVDCFSGVCGMLPFLRKDHPDQFYRLFLSIFVHAGLLHLAITIIVQLWFMRDLERMIGWTRMALLYIGSGIGGNLASAIFVPYNPEVGPSGSHLGIVAALLVDVFHHRHILENPMQAFIENVVLIVFLFITGLLPYVDNWAHIFGFIFGMLITIVTFPYLDFHPVDEKPPIDGMQTSEMFKSRLTANAKRRVAVVVSFVVCVLLFVLLGYIFFTNMEISCSWCEYFNCVNMVFLTGSDHFCDNQGLSLTKWLPI